MEKLEELILELSKRELSITQRAQSLYEIQAILSEIDGLKSEIEKLNAQIGFLFVDEDKLQARKSLKTSIQGLLMEHPACPAGTAFLVDLPPPQQSP